MEISNEYAAGFFDGEGSVYAATRKHRNGDKRSPTLIVCVSQVDKVVLDLHKEKWGGSIHARKQRNRWQLQHQLVLSTRNAIIFIEDIYPYLIVKKDVATAALELGKLLSLSMGEKCDYVRIPGRTGRGQTRPQLKDEIREKVEYWHNEIRKLNSKSVPEHSTRKYTLKDSEGWAKEIWMKRSS